MKILILAGLFSSLILSTQISQAQAPEVPPGPPPMEIEMVNPAEVYVNDVLARASQMVQANDKGGAMALLTENFDRLARLRASIFGNMLDVLLAQDNIQGARSLYLQYAKHDQEFARAGIDKIYLYYVQKKDRGAAIEWTGQLMDLPPPDDLQPQIFTWRLSAICSGGVTDEARALVRNCVAKFTPETCRSIFSPAIEAFIENGKYDDAGRLLNIIEKEARGIGALQSMVTAAKARIIITQKRWDEGEAFLIKKASDLSDDDLAGFVSFAASRAKENNEFDTVDRMSVFIIKSQKEKNKSRPVAAAIGLNMLAINNKITEIPARFEQLLAMGLAPSALYSLYGEYFYTVIMLGNKDASKQMMAFGDKLSARLDNPDDKKQMALFLIDGLFTIGDYERSLQAVAANEKYWPQEWRDSTRVKIGAHLALQNKNYKEAIEDFRKYMDCVAKKNVCLSDPASGQYYTPAMLLGFNALRIGDILRDDLKDEDGARKAYDEAEQHFKKAMDEVRPNTKESAYVDEQMAKIAARKKK